MKGRSYKWILLAFLFVTFFLEQGTRQIYNAALPQIKLDFAALGVTDTQLGTVGSVFSMTFGLLLVVSGLAADFLGRKKVLVVGTLLFSLGVFGAGFAEGIGLLIALYGVLNAAGQCCIAPASYSLISQYHVKTRSLAMAIFQSALYTGIILSSVFAGVIAEMGPGRWRWAFYILGGFGLVWAALMQLGLRDALQVKSDAASADPSFREAFLALLTKPTAILIALAFGMFIYASLGIRLWLPMFIVRHFDGVGLARAAFHSVVWLNAAALVSAFLCARFIDVVGVKRPRIRLEVSALGLVLSVVPIVLLARAESFAACCAAMALLGVTIGLYEAAHYPAMFDCVEPRYRSATTGLTGCAAFIIGSFAPAVMGYMGEHLSMRTAFASLSVFYFLGTLILVPAIFRFFKKDYIGS